MQEYSSHLPMNNLPQKAIGLSLFVFICGDYIVQQKLFMISTCKDLHQMLYFSFLSGWDGGCGRRGLILVLLGRLRGSSSDSDPEDSGKDPSSLCSSCMCMCTKEGGLKASGRSKGMYVPSSTSESSNWKIQKYLNITTTTNAQVSNHKNLMTHLKQSFTVILHRMPVFTI